LRRIFLEIKWLQGKKRFILLRSGLVFLAHFDLFVSPECPQAGSHRRGRLDAP
jgi:hypothetical protein